MRGKFSPHQINELLSLTDIVGLISQYVALKPAGKNYKGLCPFHTEKTPSFTVSPDKGLWHCFGCGEGGNAFQFLMKVENITFMEAAVIIAEKSGIRLEQSQEEKKIWTDKEKLFKVIEIACGFYQRCLFSNTGSEALNYLRKRGLKDETIEKFRLGYAPQASSLLFKFLEEKKIPSILLEKAGLIKKNYSGQFIDYFYGRIIFPIFDSQGRTVAFGARAMQDKMPKYINSPESLIFKKGSSLYCLNFSKSQIIKDEEAVVVEGYFDAIKCYQEGIKKTVASMGTALTRAQVNLLARFAGRVILALDGDSAGQAATIRSLGTFEEGGLEVGIFILPPSEDPDSFIKKRGKDEFIKGLNDSENIYDYRIKCALRNFNLKKPEGKIGFVKELLPVIYSIKEKIKQDQYIKKVAQLSEVREELIRQFKKDRKILEDKEKVKVFFSPKTGQEKLLQILVNFPEKIKEVMERLPLEAFNGLKFEKIFETLYKLSDLKSVSKKYIMSSILHEIKDENIKNDFLKNAIDYHEDYSDELLQGLMKNIKDLKLKEKFNQRKKELEMKLETSSVSHRDEVFKEYQELVRYLKGSCLEE